MPACYWSKSRLISQQDLVRFGEIWRDLARYKGKQRGVRREAKKRVSTPSHPSYEPYYQLIVYYLTTITLRRDTFRSRGTVDLIFLIPAGENI
jgi:hypothetical protein